MVKLYSPCICGLDQKTVPVNGSIPKEEPAFCGTRLGKVYTVFAKDMALCPSG